MTKLRKSVLSFGSAVLAVGAFSLAVPKTAHAVAAILVQVTNTAASPAITQSVPSQAAQLVNLEGGTSGPSFSPFVSASGGILSVIGTLPSYVVPDNQSLVITDVDIAPNCSGQFDIVVGIETVSMAWSVSGLNTSHFEYHSGTVFPAATTPQVGGGSPSCPVDVRMHGYLTSN
ncbi:MAG: hypothetical protein WBE37_11375 [Bryobacteraceae bacterium]